MRKYYAGTFFVSLAILVLELALTRVWSVDMGYHFAFMAISLAVFGATFGALVVYAAPRICKEDNLPSILGTSALCCALSTVLSFITHLCIPFDPHFTFLGIYSTLLTFVLASTPFFFGGICIALVLTKLPRFVSQMYAADMLGATAGCVAYVTAINITDGPTTVFLAAAAASVGALFYSTGASTRKLFTSALVCSVLTCTYVVGNTILVQKQKPLLRLSWVGGAIETPPLYEKWNSISRINIRGNPDALVAPFLWGGLAHHCTLRELCLHTDNCLATPLPHFSGDFREIQYLKFDVSNLVYYLKSGAKVLVVGSGGGRDVLSALLFKQKSVIGVEINATILDVVYRVFGDFTGHLDRDPRVKIVNDDARSYLARTRDLYDIIEVSIVNTSSGVSSAHALTENSIYTLEAWKTFIDRLSPSGMLSCTRFYREECPGELYRLTSLATRALAADKISDWRAHILVVAGPPKVKTNRNRTATLIVSKIPFTSEVLAKLQTAVADNGFQMLLTPEVSTDSTLEKITSITECARVASQLPYRIEAPTDDCPYFFYMFSLRNLVNWNPLKGPAQWLYNYAQIVLVVVAGVVLILAALCIIAPLALVPTHHRWSEISPSLGFFAAIGFGFMLIELSQMQRLSLFLGDPALALTVALFTLLLGSSMGSLATRNWSGSVLPKTVLLCVALLTVVGLLTPEAIALFRPNETTIRILSAVLLMFPIGFVMGMPFPLGMKLAGAQFPLSTPWFWAVNGATTMCGSVLGLVLAVYLGISATFWFGVFAYICAFLTTFGMNPPCRRERELPALIKPHHDTAAGAF